MKLPIACVLVSHPHAWRRHGVLIAVIALASLAPQSIRAQVGTSPGEWRSYGADTANTHYSALEQINAANFSRLVVAWRFKADNLGTRPEFNLESTPLMANGVVYSTAGSR